ncbi:MAG: DUF4249 domain-containing protein [Cyclobacteriaceae bacterium]
MNKNKKYNRNYKDQIDDCFFGRILPLLHSFFITLSSLFILSCEPQELLIEVSPAEPKIVISSQIIPGDIMIVFVTRSFSALEGNEDTLSADFIDKIVVENAEVTLTFDGNKEILEPIEDVAGIYISNANLNFGNAEIRLDVLDPLTGESVHALTQAIPRISPDSVAFLEEVIDADTLHSIYFSFTDPPESNWFVLNAFDPGGFVESLSNNPLGFIGENNGTFHEELISDQLFDESVFEKTIKLEEPIHSDTIAFLFSNISEGYFRFLDSRQRTGGIISSATSEPINHPTNVVGGLGYFNAQNPSVKIVPKSKK